MMERESLIQSHRKRHKKVLRDKCWACGKKIEPDPAPRALCGSCACGGYFGGS